MGRKTQISKEIILQAALELLTEKGYSSINIKVLSEKIGCSTQPIVWHFGNMVGLRRALADYALMYANKEMTPDAGGAASAFEQVGRAYIRIALEKPNLFQFVFLNGSGCYPADNANTLTTDKDNAELIVMIAKELQIEEQVAGQYLHDTIIYTHGLATFAATGVMKLSESEMMELIISAGNSFLIRAGVPMEKIPSHG